MSSDILASHSVHFVFCVFVVCYIRDCVCVRTKMQDIARRRAGQSVVRPHIMYSLSEYTRASLKMDEERRPMRRNDCDQYRTHTNSGRYDCFVFVSCYLVLLHDIIHGDIARTGCYVVLSVFELPKLQPDL